MTLLEVILKVISWKYGKKFLWEYLRKDNFEFRIEIISHCGRCGKATSTVYTEEDNRVPIECWNCSKALTVVKRVKEEN